MSLPTGALETFEEPSFVNRVSEKGLVSLDGICHCRCSLSVLFLLPAMKYSDYRDPIIVKFNVDRSSLLFNGVPSLPGYLLSPVARDTGGLLDFVFCVSAYLWLLPSHVQGFCTSSSCLFSIPHIHKIDPIRNVTLSRS